jgi:hypothetical protein
MCTEEYPSEFEPISPLVGITLRVFIDLDATRASCGWLWVVAAEVA